MGGNTSLSVSVKLTRINRAKARLAAVRSVPPVGITSGDAHQTISSAIPLLTAPIPARSLCNLVGLDSASYSASSLVCISATCARGLCGLHVSRGFPLPPPPLINGLAVSATPPSIAILVAPPCSGIDARCVEQQQPIPRKVLGSDFEARRRSSIRRDESWPSTRSCSRSWAS